MSATIPFKRLILRAVLRDVNPMVARLISVSDDTELSDLHDLSDSKLNATEKKSRDIIVLLLEQAKHQQQTVSRIRP